MIHKTMLISFPRSGRDLIQRWLNGYFLEELSFIGDRNLLVKKIPIDGVFADNYKLIFTHDFNHINKYDRKNIVLFRHPIYSLISWWEYWKKEDAYSDVNNDREFDNFVKNRFEYWKAFYSYVMSNKTDNIFLIQYSDLIDNPEKSLIELIKFISTESTIDSKKIKETIRKNLTVGDPIQQKRVFVGMRSIKTCPFYIKDQKKYQYISDQTDVLSKKFQQNIKLV